MAVIAVYSVKGGVGKSTIAANLAWSAASTSKRRTLLWDLDPSGGCGFLLGADDPDAIRAARLFTQKAEAEELVTASGIARLDLLLADSSLRDLDSLLRDLGKRRRLAKLVGALEEKYETIVLDCPPVLNEVSAQVIRAADLIVVPLTPSGLSIRALDTIQADVAGNYKNSPKILPVLSMFDARRSAHRAARDAHPDWPVLPMASVVEKMSERRAPLGTFAGSSPAAAAFAGLWQRVEKECVARKKSDD